LSLRELYRAIEGPGEHALKKAHKALDDAVRDAYGMSKKADVLEALLELNEAVASAEADGKPVVGPGIPPSAKKLKDLVTTDKLTV
ncbi:hypothetical protein ABTN57_19180, partial [Acinetobacter baumannii]